MKFRIQKAWLQALPLMLISCVTFNSYLIGSSIYSSVKERLIKPTGSMMWGCCERKGIVDKRTFHNPLCYLTYSGGRGEALSSQSRPDLSFRLLYCSASCTHPLSKTTCGHPLEVNRCGDQSHFPWACLYIHVSLGGARWHSGRFLGVVSKLCSGALFFIIMKVRTVVI